MKHAQFNGETESLGSRQHERRVAPCSNLTGRQAPMPGSSRNVAFALPEAAVPVGARAAAQLPSSPVAAAASVVAETVVPAGPLDIASAHADAEAATEAEAAELVAAEVVPEDRAESKRRDSDLSPVVCVKPHAGPMPIDQKRCSPRSGHGGERAHEGPHLGHCHVGLTR